MTIPRAECIQRQGPARARFVHADTVCTSNPDGKGELQWNCDSIDGIVS